MTLVSFAQRDAKQYGVVAALVIRHLIKLLAQGGQTYFAHNKTWVKATQDELHIALDFLSKRTIQRQLRKLIDANVIVKRVSSKHRFDRTAFYAFVDHLTYFNRHKDLFMRPSTAAVSQDVELSQGQSGIIEDANLSLQSFESAELSKVPNGDIEADIVVKRDGRTTVTSDRVLIRNRAQNRKIIENAIASLRERQNAPCNSISNINNIFKNNINIPPVIPPTHKKVRPEPVILEFNHGDIPAFVKAELLNAYAKHRHALGKPITPFNKAFVLKDIQTLHRAGEDVNQCIEKSIANGWQSLVPTKSKIRSNQYATDRQAARESLANLEDTSWGEGFDAEAIFKAFHKPGDS